MSAALSYRPETERDAAPTVSAKPAVATFWVWSDGGAHGFTVPSDNLLNSIRAVTFGRDVSRIEVAPMITASIATNGGMMLGLTCADRIALTSIKALVDELTLNGVVVVGVLSNRVSVATGKRDPDVAWGWMMSREDIVRMVLR